MPEFVIDLLGWAGAFLLLLAYGLVSTGKVRAKSVVYQSQNVAGCLFLIINSTYYGAVPSAALNIIWGLFGIAALITIFRGKNHRENIKGEQKQTS